MNDWVPILVGGSLSVFGLVLVRSHVTKWREQQEDCADDNEREFCHRMYRRRMQTSCVLILVGILIPVGDQIFVHNPPMPLTFTFYFGTVLLMLFWVMFRGVRELLAISLYSRVSGLELRRRQRELHAEYERLRDIQADDRRHEWN